MSFTTRQNQIYKWYQEQAEKLKRKSEHNNGKLLEDDFWKYQYFKCPYLLLESDQYVVDRFQDSLSNYIDIGENGKIQLVSMDHYKKLSKLISELQAEMNMRQTWNQISAFKEQIQNYYDKGIPIGKKMYDKAGELPENILVKFSKKEHIKNMYEKGELRIAPAKYYEDDAPEAAMRDKEMQRLYKLQAFEDVLDGKSELEIYGNKFPIKSGFVEVIFPVNNYYMFCTCKYFSRRMPTDFNANAALVITNKEEFLARLRRSVSKELPDYRFIERDVKYYDPCNDFPEREFPEFTKHFSFTYQREHRCVWRNPSATSQDCLEPILFQLGSLEDISRPVY